MHTYGFHKQNEPGSGKMKKVCIVRQGRYPLDPRVRKEALALIDKGYKVDVICLLGPNEKPRDIDKGVNIYRIHGSHTRAGVGRYLFEYLSFFVFAKAKLCLLHARNRYDFIQVNTLPDFLVFATLFPKIFGAKVILDLHEPSPELFGSIFGANRKLLLAAITLAEKASIHFSDHAITVSEEMKRNFVGRGALASNISVILNVPNLEFRHDLYGEDNKRSDGRFSLICHGSIVKRYGQDVAIKAMVLLKEEIPSIHLDILGTGEYEGELKKLVSRLDLEDWVQFHGMIPFEDMIKMLSRADLGIVPVEKNPYSDLVHTNKMFECIAMKKPIVISRTKAVEDFFGSDDSCLKYFESGNERDLAKQVVELYHNPQKRESMIKNAFERFESVRWEILKEEYCKIFV
jgi:glycosyltransferase involved in cell wall biosynthesis